MYAKIPPFLLVSIRALRGFKPNNPKRCPVTGDSKSLYHKQYPFDHKLYPFTYYFYLIPGNCKLFYHKLYLITEKLYQVLAKY
jgi:hypothetical protein